MRTDPGLKLACGRLPDTGRDLPSQSTVSRWENAPTLREVIGLMRTMVDVHCASYARPPVAVTLDIDDTCDVVHGHQQLSLFSGHYGERCFLPIHVYDVETSRPVMVLLRPGRTPSGKEVRGHLRRLVRRIRCHWPTTRLTICGDGHYGQVLDHAAPRSRPHRSHSTRARYPLRGHQPAARQRRMDLQRPLLRPGSGGEPDQNAQGPTRLGSAPRAARPWPIRCA